MEAALPPRLLRAMRAAASPARRRRHPPRRQVGRRRAPPPPAAATPPPPAAPSSAAAPGGVGELGFPDRAAFDAAYRLGDLVGAGGYGKVFRATPAGDPGGAAVAVKQIPKRLKGGHGSPQKYLRKVRAEAEIQAALSRRCDAVVGVHGVFEDPASVLLVMDLCTGGTLLARDMAGFSEQRASAAMAAAFRALRACHEEGVVFRDVKPDNFLWRDPGRSELLLSDFGQAVRLPAGEVLEERAG